LNGRWQFVTADERRGRSRLPRRYPRSIHVPSAWELLPGLENYRGKAWLRTTVESRADRALRLVFGGVSHTGTVFLDGQEVGSHYDAYTPFAVVVNGLEPGRHTLVVEVDNSFGTHSALHIENDYYTYGGITRPVVAEHVPDTYIDKLFATPRRDGDRWQLDVRVRLRHDGDAARRHRVRVRCAGTSADLGAVTVPAGKQRQLSATLTCDTAASWRASSPTLYPVTVELVDADGNVVDDLIDRVGFREVRVDGRRLLLNGEPLRLRGYNRHEDHPQFGCALPVEAMVHDLELMRDLGCNVVRTSHYPNDQRFLDLCDEMGFYVWEESHARTVDMEHPRFREQIKGSTLEMLEWHHNHAAIVIWGCLNECASHTRRGRTHHRFVINLIKKTDPSRPVTFASMYGQGDLCLDLVDIVSWNRYDAWYAGGPTQVEPNHRNMMKWLHAKGNPARNKPVIMSEFGAGAIYGYRHPRQSKWTEEYQCRALEESLQVYLNDTDVAGALIWQFCDVRLTPEWWLNRPRNMNNKGTVDEYRRPKLCYDTVKRLMHAAASGDAD
jgi:beta-glucuronidase